MITLDDLLGAMNGEWVVESAVIEDDRDRVRVAYRSLLDAKVGISTLIFKGTPVPAVGAVSRLAFVVKP